MDNLPTIECRSIVSNIDGVLFFFYDRASDLQESIDGAIDMESQ